MCAIQKPLQLLQEKNLFSKYVLKLVRLVTYTHL